MENVKAYRMISGCTLRSLGECHLLIVYPAGKPPFALNVSESFARLFAAARALDSFAENDLARVLREQYGLDEEYALEEARKTLALWQEEGILL